MARPLRIEYAGAFYHVTARGNERRAIFRDDRDREKFLGYLESAALRYKAAIHVYCLMNNHYHLLMSTPSGNLSQILQHINGAYTVYFNKRHQRTGHLFQGRYKAILVDADEYAGELSRYIHLNPVRAKITGRPENYSWTSYAACIGRKTSPRWLTVDWLLRYFGENFADAKKVYREFVEAKIGSTEESPLSETFASAILGRTEFIDDIRERFLGGVKKHRSVPALTALTKILPEVIGKTVLADFRDEPALAKKVAIYLSHRYSGATLREIGRYFGIGDSAVSQASHRLKLQLAVDGRLRRRVEKLHKILNLSNVET